MNDKFSTSDIVLAASLKIKGYSLVSIEQTGNKGVFIFADVDKEFLSEYDLGKILVEPVAFNNIIRTLTTSVKRLLQSGERT